jgi:hypothetical protein
MSQDFELHLHKSQCCQAEGSFFERGNFVNIFFFVIDATAI